MHYEDSENYVEEPEKYPLVQRYSVTMSFNDIDDGIKIDGTVEFEIEVEIPRYPEDLEAVAEKKAFLTIEAHADYGRGTLPNLHIDTMDKGFIGHLNQEESGPEPEPPPSHIEDPSPTGYESGFPFGF